MILRALIAMLCLAASAAAQRSAPGARESDSTALGALKLLPKDIAKRVARIEAREGTPWPDRWYVLAYDPSEPRGLREFVFAGGRQVAARNLSQFADTLDEGDIIGADAIKVNSDTVAGIAGQFALHNAVRLGSVNYELQKTGTPPVPAWRLTCLDPAGDQIGTILVHAGKGSVLAFDGFQKAPFAVQPEPPAAKAAAASAGKTPPPKTTKPKPPPRVESGPPGDSTVTKPFRKKPAPKPGPIDRAGNSIRKLFRRGD